MGKNVSWTPPLVHAMSSGDTDNPVPRRKQRRCIICGVGSHNKDSTCKALVRTWGNDKEARDAYVEGYKFQEAAEKAAKQQQKAAEKAAKQQQKAAEKAAEQQQKAAEKAAEKAAKQQQKAAEAAAKKAAGAAAKAAAKTAAENAKAEKAAKKEAWNDLSPEEKARKLKRIVRAVKTTFSRNVARWKPIKWKRFVRLNVVIPNKIAGEKIAAEKQEEAGQIQCIHENAKWKDQGEKLLTKLEHLEELFEKAKPEHLNWHCGTDGATLPGLFSSHPVRNQKPIELKEEACEKCHMYSPKDSSVCIICAKRCYMCKRSFPIGTVECIFCRPHTCHNSKEERPSKRRRIKPTKIEKKDTIYPSLSLDS